MSLYVAYIIHTTPFVFIKNVIIKAFKRYFTSYLYNISFLYAYILSPYYFLFFKPYYY